MRKLSLNRGWNATLLGLMLLPLTALADKTSIEITGRVVEQPCVVDGGANITVDLGQNILSNTISDAGGDGSWTYFSVKAKNCPSSKSEAIAEYSGTGGYDSYSNTGTAEGVDVQLQISKPGVYDVHKGDGAPLGPGHWYYADINTDRTALFTMRARPIRKSSNQEVTPGTINAVVMMTFIYE